MMEEIPAIRPDFDEPNYDESKVAPYTLEDPLTFADGTPVRTMEDWQRRRREILDIFAHEMYGQEPPAPEALVIEKELEKEDAVAGFAVRTHFKMWFKADKSGPFIRWMLIRPRYAKAKVPVIIYLNFNGNHELLPDEDIPISDSWIRNSDVTDHHQTAAIRGRQCNPSNRYHFPVATILARGYAVLTACYCDVSPDPERPEIEKEARFQQDTFAYTGVFDLWGKRDESRTDNITSLGAWAWALSRGLDLAEQLPELDAKRAVVTGCSRLGKAALIAMARDERFAVGVPNQCGGGGVCLAKRDFGENVATEMRKFKHWYCKAYGKYERNPARLLPFDQHLFLASIAPRPVLVEGFTTSDWMDPKGEFLACRAASPAWTFCGVGGMPEGDYPEIFSTDRVGSHLGFVLRPEEHGLYAQDWIWMMDFADKHLK